MGWKCPRCRQHVWDRSRHSKCPYCNPNHCDICDRVRDTQDIHEHHIDYDHDVTINVCETCHEKIHFVDARSEQDDDEFLDRLNPLEAA